MPTVPLGRLTGWMSSGTSSLVIVPVPGLVPIVALVTLDMVTVKLSSPSGVVSLLTVTGNVLLVSPGAKENPPRAAT